jgi:hypothetical protein
MTPTYKPLRSSDHGSLKLVQGSLFFLNERPLVPVSVVEAPRAALDMPVVFTRNEAGGLALMALLSLDKETNVHVGPKGRWMGGYMPVVVQAYPFGLAFQDDQAVVVVNSDSDWLTTAHDQGRVLFDGQGSPTDLLNRIIDLLRNRAPNPLRDNPVLAAIDGAGILGPWEPVPELLCVNPGKLGDLDDALFLALRQASALPVIYAHLMSLSRIRRIRQLGERKTKMAEHLKKKTGGISLEQDTGYDLGTMIG